MTNYEIYKIYERRKIVMEIKMFGHYYRMFKGTGGIPTKVTVVGIEGDIVTLVRGHLTKEDFEEMGEQMPWPQ